MSQQIPDSAITIVVPMTEIEARELVEEIKIGISTVGQKLLELYEREGWRALGYSNWRECVMTEFDFQQSRVYQLLDFARIERNLSTNGGNLPLPTSERQARPLTKLEPEVQRQAWQKAVDTAPNGKVTAKYVEQVVNEFREVAISPARFHAEESDPFTCPRCGKRTVKVNGGAICLNEACGAKWDKRDEYEIEVEIGQEKDGLTVDFNGIAPAQLETDLAALEAGGYGEGSMAQKIREELDRRVFPEPVERLSKEQRGLLKSRFADGVNYLPAAEFQHFEARLRELLSEFKVLR